MSQNLKVIDLCFISPNPYQPRKTSFDLQELEQLAQTIKEVGVLHPPLVRKISPNTYELIAGERRYRAAKIAGLKKMPVLIDVDNKSDLQLSALIENIQRVNLNPVEYAKALKSLLDEKKLTHEKLSQSLGIKRTNLSNYLRLLNLSEEIQDALTKNIITMGHAKVILSLNCEQNQRKLYHAILKNNLSVRAAEKEAFRISKPHKERSTKKDTSNIFLQQITEVLQKKMGTKVEFLGNEKKGSIQLHYYSLSDLNRLLHELGYSEEAQ